MASSTLSQYFSSIATDPLRSFRFNASFTAAAATGAPAGTGTLPKITDSNSTNVPSVTGASAGWVGGFTSVSGLNISTQAIPYREGGYNTTVHQIPGMTTFQPVQFSRGVLYGNDQALSWMRGMFAAAAGEGTNSVSAASPFGLNFRVDVTITVNEHPNTSTTTDFPKMAFKIRNAWITGLNYTDLDATNGAILFETMTLTHEGLSVYFTDSNGNAITA
jgi:phage tail-like protein